MRRQSQIREIGGRGFLVDRETAARHGASVASALIWLLSILASALHLLSTKWAVRLTSPKSDNALDNALGYLAISAFTFWPLKWLWTTQWWSLLFTAGPIASIALHVWALKAIYQVSRKRAFLIALVQFVFLVGSLSITTVVVGLIAAYILYGRIIGDPIWLIKLVLRLIGVLWPPYKNE